MESITFILSLVIGGVIVAVGIYDSFSLFTENNTDDDDTSNKLEKK
jgi:hypothetical protein